MALPATGLLVVKGNEDIERAEQEKRDADREAGEPLRSSLLEYVNKRYTEAEEARNSSGQTARMTDALRRRNSEYDAATLAQITKYQLPKIHMHTVEIKCDAAAAWMQDIENTVADRTWYIEETPEPELPEEDELRIQGQVAAAELNALQEGIEPTPDQLYELETELRDKAQAQRTKEASAEAKRMEESIRDDLVQGNYREAKKEFRDYCSTIGTAFLKGPMPRLKTHLEWVGNTCEPIEEIVYETDVPHPLDMFCSPASSKFSNGYQIERKRNVSIETLSEWIKLPGYDKEALSRLIASPPNGTSSKETSDYQRSGLESKASDAIEKSGGYECFEFWGPIEGKYLVERDLKADPDETYKYHIEWSGGEIILSQRNPDPLGASIYHDASYVVKPGSAWGKGIPHLIPHADDLANGSGRALSLNMAMASAPQVDADLNQIDPDTLVTSLIPYKVWPTYSKPGISRKAIEFFQPRDNSASIIGNLDRAMKLADDGSNIPAYTYGSDAPAGAGGTASGYAMLQNAAARGMKDALWNMDLAIISYIRRLYVMKRLYDEDLNIRGDCRIVAKGTMGVLLQELHQAQVSEFIDRILTPLGVEIFGPESIVKAMHEYGELLKIDHNEILPSSKEVLERLRQESEAQGQKEAAEQARQMAIVDGQEQRADSKTKIETATAAEDIRGKQAERASQFLNPNVEGQ